MLPVEDVPLPVPFQGVRKRSANNTLNLPTKLTVAMAVCPGCGDLTFLVDTVGPHVLGKCFFCAKKSGIVGLHPGAYMHMPKKIREKSSNHFGVKTLCAPVTTHMITTAEKSLESDLAATVSRTLKHTPPIHPVEGARMLALVDWFVSDVLRLDEWLLPQPDFELWISHSNISPANKVEIRRAWDGFSSVLAQHLDMGCASGKGFCSEPGLLASKVAAFVKSDKEPTDLRARTICSMSPLVTAITAQVLWIYQQLCEQYMDGAVYFAAGKKREQMDEFFSRGAKGGKWFATDCTNWDSLMKDEIQDTLMKIYSKIRARHPHALSEVFWAVLRHQKYTIKGRTAMGLGWGIRGVQKSGAYDTCLGNSLANALIHVCCIADTLGMPPYDLIRSGFLLTVLGDDILFYVPEHLLRNFKESTFLRKARHSGLDIKFEMEEHRRRIFLNLTPTPIATAEELPEGANLVDVAGSVYVGCVKGKTLRLSKDGLPLSALDAPLCVVAPMCSGKTTLTAALSRAKVRVHDPDSYFPPNHQTMTTRTKYKEYVKVCRGAKNGIFFFHDIDSVPLCHRAVLLHGTREEHSRRALARDGSDIMAMENFDGATSKRLQVYSARLSLENAVSWLSAAANNSFLDLADAPLFAPSPILETFTPLAGRLWVRLFNTLSDVTLAGYPAMVCQLCEAMFPQVAHNPLLSTWLKRMYELHLPLRGRAPCRSWASESLAYKVSTRCPGSVSPRFWSWAGERYNCSDVELKQLVVKLATMERGSNLSALGQVAVQICDVDWRPSFC